jgi:adenosylmethionine-8-amino-7-oxononanoate aminotransferase
VITYSDFVEVASRRRRPRTRVSSTASDFVRADPSSLLVVEPISINLGVLIADHDVIRRVRELCRRYGTLFIADEVACGFGRTGRIFACEHFDLDPDMLCVAKAMSGGLAPIGAVIATAPIAKSMEKNDGTFYSTYGWHPRSVDAALATLRSLKTNRARLLSSVAEMSE